MSSAGTPRFLTVSARDPLPTSRAIRMAKAEAFSACAAAAFGLGWPIGAAGVAMIQRAPLVALDVLSQLCPGVADAQLARCLGLDPHVHPNMLRAVQQSSVWPHDVVRRAVLAAGGQGR